MLIDCITSPVTHWVTYRLFSPDPNNLRVGHYKLCHCQSQHSPPVISSSQMRACRLTESPSDCFLHSSQRVDSPSLTTCCVFHLQPSTASLTDSLAHSPIPPADSHLIIVVLLWLWLAVSLTHWLTHSLSKKVSRWLTRTSFFTLTLTSLLAHSLTHSLIDRRTHTLSHPTSWLTHSPIPLINSHLTLVVSLWLRLSLSD